VILAPILLTRDEAFSLAIPIVAVGCFFLRPKFVQTGRDAMFDSSHFLLSPSYGLRSRLQIEWLLFFRISRTTSTPRFPPFSLRRPRIPDAGFLSLSFDHFLTCTWTTQVPIFGHIICDPRPSVATPGRDEKFSWPFSHSAQGIPFLKFLRAAGMDDDSLWSHASDLTPPSG